MPDWLLILLAILSLLLPNIAPVVADMQAAFKPGIEQPNIRSTILVLCWLAAIGFAFCMQLYGHSRHPDWWNFSLGQLSNQESAGWMAIVIIFTSFLHFASIYLMIKMRRYR